ncbi:MAG: transcriptional regulator [Schwartzia sp.]|nr:transcriptional regulator [Schwartzia sp. (in: firmicutes)]
MLEEFLRRSSLFDLYGALLTEKQQRCLSMSLYDDYSLSEIGETLGISRQAVHDMLRRSEQIMEDYESCLGLLARRDVERETLARVYHGLQALHTDDEAAKNELLRLLVPLAGLEDMR